MTPQPRRLAEGGRIDRSRPLSFSFDGRALLGYAGDTLASALLANGVDVVSRSFKYARPRGIVGHGPEEPNAILHLGKGAHGIPNLRATEVELFEGLEARSTRSGPQRLVGAFSRFLPAGFYYKTFMQPPWLWMAWERLLRRAAGFGEAPDGPDPDTYDKMHHHCDVLVVGAGPAGLAAALEAARCRRPRAHRRRTIRVRRQPPVQVPDRRRRERRRLGAGRPRRTLVLSGRNAPAPRHGHRLLRSQLLHHPRAACRPSGTGERQDFPPTPAPRTRAPGRARDRRHRTAPGVRQQRPARRHAGIVGLRLRQPVRRRARRQAGAVHHQRRCLPNGAGLAAGWTRSGRSGRCAAGSRRRDW